MLRSCSLLLIFAAALHSAPCDLIVSGRYVVTMDAQRRIIQNGAVAIRADSIVASEPAPISTAPGSPNAASIVRTPF